MSKWKSSLLLLLCISLVLPLLLLPSSAEEAHEEKRQALPPPSVSAQSAVLMEAESGALLYQKQADIALPMASTTKIMTALVALELASPETAITVSPEAVGIEGSSIYLRAGEVLRLEELLYALLLESANDAAAAIAIGLSGSIEEFAAQMNRKAAALGLENTHFTNPHGLDHAEHYTTAEELALITRCAMENERFAAIVSTTRTNIPNAQSGVRTLINHNKLLHLYDGCIGVKTGFTKKSGRCLVSAAERDGVRLIAVTLHAPDDWDDHAALFDYGFSNYRSRTLCEAEEFRIPLHLVGGEESYVVVSNPQGLSRTLSNQIEEISYKVLLPRFSYAAIDAGMTVGAVVYYADTDRDGAPEELGSVPLVTCYEVKQYVKRKTPWQWILTLFGFL